MTQTKERKRFKDLNLLDRFLFAEAKNEEQARELIAPEILLQFPLPVQRFQLHIQYIQSRLR